ncbi:MAG: hypothetical protein KY441_04355 [Actinobacteria bacterium]|nr:hypothetical protein [Actinomycetota bacterium]
MSARLDAALAAGDLDELLREVDRLCEARDWDGLVRLREASRTAFLARGHQLWPVASQVEYRLALEAPGPWAASVLVEGSGRFSRGPLPEVAASTHTWAELAPHLPAGPAAGLVAHERAVHGEDLRGDQRADAGVLEVPLALLPWEPAYCLATYRAHGADFPAPPAAATVPVTLPAQGTPFDDDQACRALLALVEPWVVESNGTATAVAVRGSAEAAVAALGLQQVGWAEVTPGEALSAMAWAGASGGAHGRRRGAAVGRFGAWWALAGLLGLVEEWPVPPADLGEAVDELRWARWEPEHPSGWSLHLAVEDRDEGLAWAVAATDRA